MVDSLGLNSLTDNIQNDSSNWTRFVLIEPESAAPAAVPQNAKSSLLFTVPDKVGSLTAVLELFSRHNVNMSKLESRPMKGERWKYVFFADVECAIDAPEYAVLLQEMKDSCSSVRVLGCYPSGPHLDSTINSTGY
jgi:chorismate mutase/prephenate dehydratase